MSLKEEQSHSVAIADPQLGTRESQRVAEVVESGRLAAGETVTAFEEAFAEFCGADTGVATSNGTTALHAALEALGIGEGDRVITTPFSFIASANAIRLAGAEPVFADIDYETYNLDPHAVEATIRQHDGDVDALLVVHLYGLPAAMEALTDIADTYDLAVVEDACQAHGARYRGDHVGTIGDIGCFSFYPTKNMTTGEGGAIVTDREAIAERARRYVNHGRDGGDSHVDVGHNFRMTNVAAALGMVQLERLPSFNRARRANAEYLTEALEKSPVVPPVEPDGRRHVYHQYTVRVDDRDTVRERLDEVGIGTGVYYPTPIHRQPAYDETTATAPVAEHAAGEVLSLPVHPNCPEAALDTAASVLKSHATDD
ncbi:DegT/DnrJ/EryC1/StrS family aminotransferase [Halorientalis litorea]|uniref:DegT/DnrJ/EryC1/StrS family aminotransferase n=1 Tax=Halorientalis litorea TaxID=2931977 RepID=UPI001FF12D6D|nr:DegT/DnrJ/EryC1/StrS family aminotransferase [Halorientalis litorea]